MKKKILFLINGLGLGNSTRCFAIIQRLKKLDNDISIVTSGNGKWFFDKKKEIDNLYFNEPIHYGAINNELSIKKTLLDVPNIFRTIKENSNRLKSIIDILKPDVILTDSVYNFPSIKKFSIPIIALNNSDLTVDYFKKLKQKPKSIFSQYYFVEQLDFLYHKLLPDIVISPCFLNEDIENFTKRSKFKRIGPIVRSGIKKRTKKINKRGAIMLSGSNFGVEINLKKKDQHFKLDIIGRDKPLNWIENKNVIFHGKIKNNIDLINNMDFCVVNGGYSALSELYWAKIPMIVVPVPNHAEQWTNAKQIEKSGCGIISDKDNYEKAIDELSRDFEKFEDNYDKAKIDNSGTDNAANIILNV
tara:strand:+ start:1410 stop:2486 length:1077 start_codon:yes stop_codon:yes gene_type:complete